MRVEELRAELTRELLGFAWDQWSQMGVSAGRPERRAVTAADPEALLLLTLDAGRSDPRLFDEVLDWLAHNEPLISVHRLRGLCDGDAQRALVDAALAWANNARRPKAPPRAKRHLEPLFPSGGAAPEQRDPFFAGHGFARAPLSRSGKSQAPHYADPINFAFRMRRLLGVGVRSEILRVLLTVDALRVEGTVIAAEAGFARRNVNEGLSQLHDAGVITIIGVAGATFFEADRERWAAVLEADSRLPTHYDWIAALRALGRVQRWLSQPELDDLSDYMRASEARTLLDEITADLRYAGQPITVTAPTEPSFWSEFEETVLRVARDVRAR